VHFLDASLQVLRFAATRLAEEFVEFNSDNNKALKRLQNIDHFVSFLNVSESLQLKKPNRDFIILVDQLPISHWLERWQ